MSSNLILPKLDPTLSLGQVEANFLCCSFGGFDFFVIAGHLNFKSFGLCFGICESGLDLVSFSQVLNILSHKKIVRKSGRTAGKVDVYYYPEKGAVSKNDIEQYCQEKGIDYNPDED